LTHLPLGRKVSNYEIVFGEELFWSEQRTSGGKCLEVLIEVIQMENTERGGLGELFALVSSLEIGFRLGAVSMLLYSTWKGRYEYLRFLGRIEAHLDRVWFRSWRRCGPRLNEETPAVSAFHEASFQPSPC